MENARIFGAEGGSGEHQNEGGANDIIFHALIGCATYSSQYVCD